MKRIGKYYYHEIRKENWKNIEVAYELPDDFINKYLCNRKQVKEIDNEYHYVTEVKLIKLCKDLSLHRYHIKESLPKDLALIPKYRYPDRVEFDNFKSIRCHINKAIYMRDVFLEARADLGDENVKMMENTKKVENYPSDEKVIELLSIQDEEYFKSPLTGDKSKEIFLREKIFQLGCLVFETGSSYAKVSSSFFLGAFIRLEEWPIILINSFKSGEEPGRKIFTILHEVYHLLHPEKDENGLPRNEHSLEVSKVEEGKANDFASKIIFPKKYWEKDLKDVDFHDFDQTYTWLKKNNEKYGASMICQMICLKKEGIIDVSTFNNWKKKYDTLPRKKAFGKYSVSITKGRLFSPSVVRYFDELYISEKYTTSQVAKSLGIRYNQVEDVLERWRN